MSIRPPGAQMDHGIRRLSTFRGRIWAEIHFRYERFLALRGSAIYVLLLLCFGAVYLMLVGVYSIALSISGETWKEPISLPWHVFLELLSPAKISNISEPSLLFKILAIVTTLVGIGFLSTLIAYTTATTTNIIRRFRRGTGVIPERGHTLLLGFDERVTDIVRELEFSNQSKWILPVVILADREKQDMDESIGGRLFRSKRVRLSTARGEPANALDLRRINAREARSAIILARCNQTASRKEKQSSDTRVLQTIKSVYACQDPSRRFPIIAEIFDPVRRELISELDSKIISVDSNRFLASILVQSAITPGLERVYQELLSFEMSELYFCSAPAGEPFGELVFHYVDGIPIGYLSGDKQVHFLPPDDHIIQEDEEVILIASDDSRIDFSTSRLYYPRFGHSHLIEHRSSPQKILLIGWHYLAPLIFEECLKRLPVGSELSVMVPDRPESLVRCFDITLSEQRGIDLRLLPVNPFDKAELKAQNPFSYDSIILLSQSGMTETEEQMDADTLMLILLLRKLRDELRPEEIRARVVTQLFRTENLRLIEEGDQVDFIQSSQVATSLLTQLSEEEDLVRAYNHLFLQRECALDLKPVSLYIDEFSEPVRFIDLFGAAMSHHEVCVGIQCSDPSLQGPPYYGVYVNPPKEKSFQLQKDDQVIVLYRQTNF